MCSSDGRDRESPRHLRASQRSTQRCQLGIDSLLVGSRNDWSASRIGGWQMNTDVHPSAQERPHSLNDTRLFERRGPSLTIVCDLRQLKRCGVSLFESFFLPFRRISAGSSLFTASFVSYSADSLSTTTRQSISFLTPSQALESRSPHFSIQRFGVGAIHGR